MPKITAIQTRRGREKRVNIFLDNKLAFSLETELAAKEGLQIDQVLSSQQIEALGRSARFHHSLKIAHHYLSYRPRSEFELREKFRQRGFDSDIQEMVIAKLKERGLVDDIAFAQFWKNNRESFSPRSRWLTKLELKRKGIANDIIDQVTEAISDENSAYQAALTKVRSLTQVDHDHFQRRLGQYLRQRGFNYAVIKQTIERLWREQISGDL